MTASRPARTYNQDHIARPHDGRRRMSIYWTWSYPWEAQRDPAAMENRFYSTMEDYVRAVAAALATEYRTIVDRGLLRSRRAAYELSEPLDVDGSHLLDQDA